MDREQKMRVMNVDTLIGHHFYWKLIGNNSTILDIGSNIGEFSKSISEKYNCTCYAVEPYPEHFKKIPETNKVRKFNYAISDKSGDVFLHLSNTNPMAHTILEGRPGCENEIRVPAITLENFINALNIKVIDILKIDIEGAEIRLFNSTPSSIIKQAKQITIEFHAFVKNFNIENNVYRIIKYLKGIGFYYIDFTKKNTDVLFLNKNYYTLFDYLKVKYFAKNLERVFRKLKRFGLLK